MDLATFTERYLRRRLWPHQLEAAESPAFITSIGAARRTGKTVLAETLAVWTAFSTRGCKVLALSATLDSARRLTESIATTLAEHPETRGATVDAHATRIRLRNGSEIISLPASQRQVRGYGKGVRLVILDEAGFMPSELWAAAHYTALDERANGSRLLLCGTPWGPREHFFRRAFLAGGQGDPDYSSHHWTHEVNPNLDAAYLERQRDRVSPAEYAAEVLGEWSDAAGSLFPAGVLHNATADVELPTLAELRGPARPILGLDYGVSFDMSAAVAIYRLPVRGLNRGHDGRPVFIALPHVWPQSLPLSTVVDHVVACEAPFAFIGTEVSGVGAMPSQEVRRRLADRRPPIRWCSVATTAQKKTAGYGALLGLLEQGRLVLPRHPALLRQLAGLRFEQGERGFTRIEAENPVVHDDVADAAMLAALPYTPAGGKRVVCGLVSLADPNHAEPDTPVPELVDVPVVETGAGLRLYARPALQSVGRDGALTLPSGIQLGDTPQVTRDPGTGIQPARRA